MHSRWLGLISSAYLFDHRGPSVKWRLRLCLGYPLPPSWGRLAVCVKGGNSIVDGYSVLLWNRNEKIEYISAYVSIIFSLRAESKAASKSLRITVYVGVASALLISAIRILHAVSVGRVPLGFFLGYFFLMAVQFPSQQAEEQLITSTSFVMVGLPFLLGITNRVSPPSSGLYQYMNIYNVAPFSAVVEQWLIWDARCKLYVNRRLSRSEGSQNLLLFPALYGSLKEIFFSYTAAKKRTAHAVISLDANIAKAWFMRALVTWCLLLLAMSILTPKKGFTLLVV